MTKTILRALRGEVLPTPPIWMMRQAGRYLPEYRATRAEAGDFLSLCYNSELAAEVTLQPIRRYGFDAAILFADILLLPQALGLDLWFETGEGPRGVKRVSSNVLSEELSEELSAKDQEIETLKMQLRRQAEELDRRREMQRERERAQRRAAARPSQKHREEPVDSMSHHLGGREMPAGKHLAC